MVKVITTPHLVKEATEGLFTATMNLPYAARHCGMTEREMKMTFREYLKYHPPSYGMEEQLPLPLNTSK